MPNLPSRPQTVAADTAERTILFLLSHPETTANDNHHRLPAAFRAVGWQVATASHQSLRLSNGTLECSAGALAGFARLWLLGFGAATSFFDRMQLLLALPENRFVVSPRALLSLHGKFYHLQHSPETYVSSDLEFLASQVQDGDTWVVKPTAGSNADGVRFAMSRQTVKAALEPLLTNNRFALLQRYCPAIEDGEHRVLCAAGKVIASYLRVAQPGSVTNLSRGAHATLAPLAPSQRRLAVEIASDLLAQGVAYCAVDLAGDTLIESNIANPGGLGTLADLTGKDFSTAVVQALIEHWAN